jgi:hypothetical protein
MSKKSQNYLITLFLPLFLFGYLFNIKFDFFGVGTLYPSALTLILIGIFGCILRKTACGAVFVVVSPLYVALALASISFGINAPNSDYFLVGALFLLATVGLCSFGFFDLFSHIKGQALLRAAIAALTINAVLMILMFALPEFQLGYLSKLSDGDLEVFGGGESAIKSMHRFRMIGATGFATYSVAFAQVIGLFLLTTYYYIDKRKLDIMFLVVSVILVLSAVLSARSSFFGILLWTVFSAIYYRRQFISIFACSFILLVVFLVALISLLDADGADFFTTWILDLFVSGASSESLTENIQMLDVTFSDAGLLGFSRWFGDYGYDYFRSIDVGFIRLILAGGFGALFLIIFHFLLIGLVFFQKKDCFYFRTLYFFLMLYFFAVMFKGAILFDFFAFDFLILMLCWISEQKTFAVEVK